jgi:cell wall-associated NlpC family hydrolase
VFAHSRRAVLAALATAFLVAATPGASLAVDQQQLVVSAAQAKIGAKFQLGAEGPTRFDCSGLVWWSFSTTGLADYIGGKRMRAREYQSWFRARGLLKTSASAARVGDLVFYANPAKHTGIVIGFKNGRPRVVSALTSGVAVTYYNTLNVPFHSFGSVGLGVIPSPTPTPTPRPSPTPTASPAT